LRLGLRTPADLLKVADDTAKLLDYRFTPRCWDLLQKALGRFDPYRDLPARDDAARHVKTPEARGYLAEVRVAQWVGAMMEEAVRLGLAQLEEQTFAEARRHLCPLWPIC